MLPYPPDGGASIRTYNVLRLLSRTFEVTALCFYRWKPGYVKHDVGAAVRALSEFAEVEAFPIPQEHSRLRRFRDHLLSTASRRVYTYFTFESKPYEKTLSDLLQERCFDLVHVDSLDLSYYFHLLDGNIPVVCTHHDVQSLLLARRAARQTSLFMGAYLRLQSRLMEREEQRWCPRLSLNVAVSELDCQRLGKAAPGSRCTVVPNGVDTEYFRPGGGTEEGIVSVGGTSWFPNRDGLLYYTDEIAPLIQTLAPGVKTIWVGRANDDDIRAFGDVHGVQLTGYVEDVRPYICDAACYVVPLRVGGGTRVKILDAWSMGKAVVSTSLGCEGLDARDGENILVADTPTDFADAVRRVLEDPELRRGLGANARRTVQEQYSWDVIGEGLNRAYLDLFSSGETQEV